MGCCGSKPIDENKNNPKNKSNNKNAGQKYQPSSTEKTPLINNNNNQSTNKPITNNNNSNTNSNPNITNNNNKPTTNVKVKPVKITLNDNNNKTSDSPKQNISNPKISKNSSNNNNNSNSNSPVKKTNPNLKKGSNNNQKIEDNIKIVEPLTLSRKNSNEQDLMFMEERLKRELRISDIKIEAKTNREKIIQEILKTEQTYVQSLKVFKNRILVHLVEEWANKNQRIPLQELLSKVEGVDLVNSTLLGSLEEAAMTNKLLNIVGSVFKTLIPFLKLYSEYTVCYEKTLAFTSDMCDDPSFIKFFQSLNEKYQEDIKLNFGSYAIIPIQRIPRYELLLKELLKETPQSHPDYDNIKNALDEVKKVANIVNQSITKAKNLQKITEIEKVFFSKIELVDPSRTFIKEGWLTKVCRKSEKKRMFWLFSDRLIYGQIIIGVGKFVISDDSHILKTKVEDKKDDEVSFKIYCEKKSFIVKADTPAEKQDWLEKLEITKDGEKKRRKSFERENTEPTDSWKSYAPVLQKLEESKECHICSKEFNSVSRPKRHCRRCGKVSCESCSKARIVIPSLHPKKGQRVCDFCA